MFYTIYKTTNLLNGKIYIGKHQTKDLNDGYIGSGKLLKRSIKKYGIENFKKDIIFQFDNESDMNAKEAELVTEDFCFKEDTYNLCVGGRGGFSYIRNHHEYANWQLMGSKKGYANGLGKNPSKYAKLANIASQKAFEYKFANDAAFKQKCLNSIKKARIASNSELAKDKKRKTFDEIKHQQGSNNSQHGTMWITNGQANQKIKKGVDFIPEGWYKGRCLKNVGKVLR